LAAKGVEKSLDTARKSACATSKPFGRIAPLAHARGSESGITLSAGDNEVMASREKELMDRIRQLEEQNNALQDKLDMIYAILEPDYEIVDEEPEGQALVKIDAPRKEGKKSG